MLIVTAVFATALPILVLLERGAGVTDVFAPALSVSVLFECVAGSDPAAPCCEPNFSMPMSVRISPRFLIISACVMKPSPLLSSERRVDGVSEKNF